MAVDDFFERLFGGSFGGVRVFVVDLNGTPYQPGQSAGRTSHHDGSSRSSLPVIDLYDAGGNRFRRLQEFDEGQLVRLLQEDPAVRWERGEVAIQQSGSTFLVPVPGHFSMELGAVRAELHYGCRAAPSSQPMLCVSDSGAGSSRTYSGAGITSLYRHVAQQAYR